MSKVYCRNKDCIRCWPGCVDMCGEKPIFFVPLSVLLSLGSLELLSTNLVQSSLHRGPRSITPVHHRRRFHRHSFTRGIRLDSFSRRLLVRPPTAVADITLCTRRCQPLALLRSFGCSRPRYPLPVPPIKTRQPRSFSHPPPPPLSLCLCCCHSSSIEPTSSAALLTAFAMSMLLRCRSS